MEGRDDVFTEISDSKGKKRVLFIGKITGKIDTKWKFGVNYPY
jgi:hypothetical protein